MAGIVKIIIEIEVMNDKEAAEVRDAWRLILRELPTAKASVVIVSEPS